MTNRFADLSPEEQQQVISIGQAVASDLRRFVVGILVGPSLSVNSGGKVDHASGVITQLGDQLALVTADHVVRRYERRRSEESSLIFQVGDARLDPTERVLWRSRADDLIFLAVRPADMPHIGRTVYPLMAPWPPIPPLKDAWLCVWGYPVQYRTRPTPNSVDLTLMGAIMRVTSRGLTNLKCVFERDVLVPVVGEVPHAETDFGGMSGGPAFLMDGTRHQLIGLVTDHSSMIDMLQIQTFDNIPHELRLPSRSANARPSR